MGIKVFHLVHGKFRGEALMPSRANVRDPAAYIYAAGVEVPEGETLADQVIPTECLPFCSPNGTRILNHTDLKQGYTLTIIPDRAAFMQAVAEGRMRVHGTIYELPAEKFTKSPYHDSQYICATPIHMSEMRKVVEINTLNEAMALGLHVLFTREPCTVNNQDFYLDIARAPDFPDNLAHYIKTGVFDYENQRQGINPLPWLSTVALNQGTAQARLKPKRPHCGLRK